MSLLKQATGIGGHSGEELKHEGVMDMFKSKNIQTTERALVLISYVTLSNIPNNQKDDFIYKIYDVYEGDDIKISVGNIDNTINHFKKYLSSGKTEIIITKKYVSEKLGITKDAINALYHLLKNSKDVNSGLKSLFHLGPLWRIFNHNENYNFKNDIIKKIEELGDIMEKVIIEMSKEISLTDSEVTKETAINQDWLATKNEIQLLSETASTFTTESASNFISNIKTFFTNSLMGINNALSNFMKTYTITDKYFKDNVNMLNSKSSVINSIVSKKFFEIENIETKCVVGMKLNYLGTTKELKIFASKIPEIKTSIDGVSNFIENLYNNHNDARLSNIKNLDNLTELSSKTTEIISELIDGKSIKENVTIGNLFPNSNGIKIVKDELIEVNNILYKADVEALNKSVNRLISVVTIFLKEINENEATYSKGVINSLQYSVKETADIITNFGTFLVLSNQFTSYYLTTIDVIKDNAK